jgi:hypothetical protein
VASQALYHFGELALLPLNLRSGGSPQPCPKRWANFALQTFMKFIYGYKRDRTLFNEVLIDPLSFVVVENMKIDDETFA